ncbi:YciI family protein [Nocardioides sp.]|uniref:YciI family protein n=1 Tax=Nocardioides sp. TaxID=35761 RepID=UPI003782F4B5
MTDYVVLIVGDDDRWWTTMSAQERKDAYAEYNRFAEELGRRGHKIKDGAELHTRKEARSIQPHSTVVTDGPFAETAEHVGGFFLVESDDLDDLLDCCKIIAAVGDGIEVRRTVDPAERPS